MFTKLSLIVTTAAATGALLLDAGIASADVGVRSVPAPGGVDVYVNSWHGNGGPPMSGWCSYTSTVQGDPIGKPLPAINVPFFLPENGPARLWFPSFPTNSTWNIAVTCPGPGGGEARITQYTTAVW
ncbi:MAG: hypothetical protein AB7G47_12285 [Mycolicibacterium sp.]|uniref:hypothetical protein n=1 Tax=Mycolicibacterium sp. TaxID=2320850 RepID=UPI003D0ECC66